MSLHWAFSAPLPISDVISSRMRHPELNRVTTGDDLSYLKSFLVNSGLAKWGLDAGFTCVPKVALAVNKIIREIIRVGKKMAEHSKLC
uniref:ARAD1D50930p n=1 Tax=Blastobotrys adeninivorans TaxID=409370 RepID=A0A060TIZ7_BLAAD